MGLGIRCLGTVGGWQTLGIGMATGLALACASVDHGGGAVEDNDHVEDDDHFEDDDDAGGTVEDDDDIEGGALDAVFTVGGDAGIETIAIQYDWGPSDDNGVLCDQYRAALRVYGVDSESYDDGLKYQEFFDEIKFRFAGEASDLAPGEYELGFPHADSDADPEEKMEFSIRSIRTLHGYYLEADADSLCSVTIEADPTQGVLKCSALLVTQEEYSSDGDLFESKPLGRLATASLSWDCASLD